MENKKQLTIGEFARLCGVTVKTLRHYEKVGLVEPVIVDDFTHYRYYSPCQMQKMNAIKSFGEVVRSSCHTPPYYNKIYIKLVTF